MNSQDSCYFNPNENFCSHKTTNKPQESYVALIARALLSSSNYQMLLVDIYQWIINEYPYFGTLQSKAWRNSIRHNLSLNECFIRQQKSENGRGYYWGIHPAAFDAFIHGDFRRRQARLRSKHADNSSFQPISWMINTDILCDYSINQTQTYNYSYS
ncbi:unnamed protein product [Adineta steineri]|uniref:Fork-head domain-containing protein n=1 Tax=Adineta steineri TaxID=433720 RepID=A0A813X2A3_9BILA|nr:unnamed protein product [Adineta steineri]CAF3850102.1 unnamed protein product [Adineta steineri]